MQLMKEIKMREMQVDEIVRSCSNQKQFLYEMKRRIAKRNLATKEEITHHTKLCPNCFSGLRWKTSEVDSLCLCVNCGLIKIFYNKVFDECVGINESYIPGITKTPKGFVAARILDGKIVRDEKNEEISPLILSPHA